MKRTIKDIDKDYKHLQEIQARIDLKLSDLSHFIQSIDELHPLRDFYLFQEFKSLREERAVVNEKIRYYQRFNLIKKKLNSNNVKKILKELSTMKELNDKPYKYRVYSNMETLEEKEEQ